MGDVGQANPPAYGDYEAQRHWMEVTTSLPVQQWCASESALHPLPLSEDLHEQRPAVVRVTG